VQAQLTHLHGESSAMANGARVEGALRGRLDHLQSRPRPGTSERMSTAELIASIRSVVENPSVQGVLSDTQRRYAPLEAAYLPGSSSESRAVSEAHITARRARLALDAGESRSIQQSTLDAAFLARRQEDLEMHASSRRAVGNRAALAGLGSRHDARRAEIAAVAGVAERDAMVAVLSDLATAHTELLRRFTELHQAMVRLPAPAPKPSGLPKEEVEHMLPRLTYASVLRGSRGYELPGGTECAVCQSDMGLREQVRLLPCRHAFHVDCIDPWFERSTCCPTCRGAVC